MKKRIREATSLVKTIGSTSKNLEIAKNEK
jgi:hypothetical protein